MAVGHFKIEISAPASIGNLAAGFDCLALALGLYNKFEMFVANRPLAEGESEFNITLSGRYADSDESMAAVPTNLFVLSFKRTRKLLCRQYKLPIIRHPILINEDVRIPPIRGLGGSASAAVAGVLAAIRFLQFFHPNELRHLSSETQDSLEECATLAMAHDIEGCPDNVCACLTGGLTYAFAYDRKDRMLDEGPQKKLHFFRQEIDDDDLRIVALIPQQQIPTARARGEFIDRPGLSPAQAAFNISRATCLPEIFRTRRYKLLEEAMKDRIHQERRINSFFDRGHGLPNLGRLFDDVIKAGAYGACVGGAGSTLVAFAPAGKAKAVADAFPRAFRNAMPPAAIYDIEETLILKPDSGGTTVEFSRTALPPPRPPIKKPTPPSVSSKPILTIFRRQRRKR